MASRVGLTLRNICGFFLAIFFVQALCGQSRTSSISGEVIDPAGGPVAGAQVRVKSVERGTIRHSVTGADGSYLVEQLEIGAYDVEVAHPGFSHSVLKAVLLALGQQARLLHKLTLTEGREAVTVAAEAVTVGATLSAVSGLVEGKQILELPLAGRDFLQLAVTRPGVHVARAHARDGNMGFGLPLSISGSRPEQNSVRLDGVHLTNQTGATPGSLLGLNLGVEAIQEFSLASSTTGVSTGRTAGGLIHAVTRSGGNSLHGSLYYFHRNSTADARNFFDGREAAAFRRHQFGGMFSGPLRKNRTFFFVNAEGLSEFEARTTINTTISDRARSGDLASGPVPVDARIRPFMGLLPSPNGEVFGDTGLYVFPNPNRGREGFVTSRLDQAFSASDTLFLRYTYDDAARRDLTSFALAERRNSTGMHSLAAEQTHVFSPRLLNTARFGWLRSVANVGATKAVSTALDNAGLGFVPGAGGPGLVVTGGLSNFEGGSGALDADRSRFDSWQLYDDLSLHRGRHVLRAGGYGEFTRFHLDSSNSPLGEFAFLTIQTLLANQPLRFRGMLPGTDTARLFRQGIYAWYLQDTWRLSRRLTAEFAVRHEWITVPTEAQGKLSNLDNLTDATPRTSGPLFHNPSRKNFGPRAGIAWDMTGNGRSTFRAGYGLYHDQILSQYLLLVGVRNPPYFLYADARDLAAGGFPSGAYQELVARPNVDLRMERLDPYPSQPYVQHWNATVSRLAAGSLQLQATYAGSHGVHLSTIVEDANLVRPVRLPDGRLFFPAGGDRINPAFGLIRDRRFDGHSFYHSLQTMAAWRTGQVHLQGTFTWAKSIDDDSSLFARTDSENSIGIPVSGVPGFNRGLSNHDVRRHVNVQLLWNLPRTAHAAGLLLNGWRLGSILTAGSGLPFTVTLAYDAARTGTSRPDYRGGQRPDWNPNFAGTVITGDPARWFRPEAFLRPAPGFLGNLGRNTFAGPAWFSADINLAREFPFGHADRARLALRLEGFNLTNHTNFALPGGRRSEVFTAAGVREDAGRITAAGPARKFQAGLRLSF